MMIKLNFVSFINLGDTDTRHNSGCLNGSWRCDLRYYHAAPWFLPVWYCSHTWCTEDLFLGTLFCPDVSPLVSVDHGLNPL